MKRFVQIAGTVEGLYALDSAGIVWHLGNGIAWQELPARRTASDRPCPEHPPPSTLPNITCRVCGAFRMGGSDLVYFTDGESFADAVATLKGASVPDDVANRWASQSLEWVAIRDALIDARPGQAVTAHDVTWAQIKRALARGEPLLTYADLVAAIHPKSED